MKTSNRMQERAAKRRTGPGRVLILWSALSAAACGTTQEPEQALTQQASALVERCEVKPPSAGVLEPELKWAWTGSAVLPTHVQVMMTPVVVDVNGDQVPDIVFSTFVGSTTPADGVLRAVSGDDGHELWTVTDPAARVKPAASLAAGDIDGDGRVEICAIPEDGRGVLCVEHDGSFKFRSVRAANDYNEWGGPSLADLDGDGTVEILDGNRVYSATGALKWVGSDGMGGAQFTGPVSFAADIDQDGKQEVVNDRALYRHDGTLLCANTTIPHGFAAVGNFDGDPAGEIVVSGRGKVSLLDHDCTLRWSIDVPGGGHGGPPTLADVDGDGQLELGVAGEKAYSVLKADGSLKWSRTLRDFSSGKIGSTAFDFEDDGQLELVVADELTLRILDAATGAVRWELANSSGTTHENPVIADVDGNHAADLVVVSNDHAYPGTHGLRVFQGRRGWAGTRGVWNQHAYSVTNVRDDGTLPAVPRSHWLQPGLNTFHANVANFFGDGPSPYAAPDLVVSELSATCDGEGHVVLRARVSNQGETPVAAGVKVAFSDAAPVPAGTRLGVLTVAEALPVNGSALVTLSVAAPPAGTLTYSATVDDDGQGRGQNTECRENNNTTATTAELACQLPPRNQPPVALCRDVTVNADASCQGRASVNAGSHDPDQGPGPLSVSESPNASFGPGRHAVTLTASDGEASAQCVGSVTVVDNTPPTITCPLSLEARIRPGVPGINLQYTVASQDACGPAPYTCSHPSGTIFPLGLTKVTCTAKDGSGNTASCDFGVRVTLGLPF
ncbi:MAG: FG-GAP-like repeat-containing protein [Cystobacter sp.]